MTASIAYKPTSLTPSLQDGTYLDIEGVIGVGTGLGYYLDPAHPMTLDMKVNGKAVSIPHPVDWNGDADRDLYMLVHLASGTLFGTYVYSEHHVKAYLEGMAALAIDWTLSTEQIVKHPLWHQLYHLNKLCVKHAMQEEQNHNVQQTRNTRRKKGGAV